jgi:hypothetical protein
VRHVHYVFLEGFSAPHVTAACGVAIPERDWLDYIAEGETVSFITERQGTVVRKHQHVVTCRRCLSIACPGGVR